MSSDVEDSFLPMLRKTMRSGLSYSDAQNC